MRANNYRDELIEQLRDPAEAGEYLTACFEESDEAFLLGLRDVVAANGGIARLSEATGLNRETLYRTLSTKGNPKLSSLGLILQALGLQLNFAASDNDPRAA
jgi:probable addiction module antidote protein